MSTINNLKESAIYVHIPFCDHKCIYCDFYSIITSDNISSFLQSLKKEIKYYAENYSPNRITTSIFFGGGTPSLMQPEYLEEIISSIAENFNVSAEAEITMETNPGTVDKEKLRKFKTAGINRISIGVQSFNDDELKFLTRIHNSKTAIETLHIASEVGFENISLDLIFNLPKQTKRMWLSNLKQAIQLPIKHISTYSLTLERGTILNKMVLDGKVTLQDNDHDADLYETTLDFFENSDFYQYEVSNFTKPGYECKHNNVYWQYGEYLGLGTSAHSFVDGKRWWNYSSLKRYMNEINTNGNAVANYEELSPEEFHNEYVMLALRSSGIKLKKYKRTFGDNWFKKNYSYFKKLENENFILLDDSNIKLTKQGYAVCDEILQNIL
ncbi:MAG: radical SAM family heme chaperone HemW [Bacteroidetes bacterium]|nr:radical SAM family heme chaperone HemW [Bacteroidota bacterium]